MTECDNARQQQQRMNIRHLEGVSLAQGSRKLFLTGMSRVEEGVPKELAREAI